MSETRQGSKNHFNSPPMSQGVWTMNPAPGVQTYGTGAGLVCVLPGSTSVQFMALSTLFTPPFASTNAWSQGQDPDGNLIGCQDSYVSVYADGVDLGIVWGENSAQVTGAYSPSLTGAGTLDVNGNYTAQGTECWRIPAGMVARYLLSPKVNKYLAFVCSASSGYFRMYQSSPEIC